MSGLWRYKGIGSKYLVVRRDGTVPSWQDLAFVFSPSDAAAPAGLRAYAAECEAMNYDPAYVADVRRLAEEYEKWFNCFGRGDPDSPQHRKDDRSVVLAMRGLITAVTTKPERKKNLPSDT